MSSSGVAGPALGAKMHPRLVVLLTGALFAVLFRAPAVTLARDWWTEPDAGHGLLLAPLALFLAWRRGLVPGARPMPGLGLVLLGLSVLLRYLGEVAAEVFTLRLSLFGALIAVVVFAYGVRQLIHAWLPVALLLLSIPLPAVVLGSLALPLQLKASQIGASLLEWRHVPVLLNGNVLHLPDRTLFVTEACSGLRSLTALISLGVLVGGLWLRHPMSRLLLVGAAIPIAMALNGLRVFLTGFLVFFVDPRLGDGFMHLTEGWLIFVVAFALLSALAWAVGHVEALVPSPRGALS